MSDIELTATINTPQLSGTVGISSLVGKIGLDSICGAVNNPQGVYVPYVGCLKDIDLGSFNLTTLGSLNGILADGVTATTQSANDNSTKVATTEYVDNIKDKYESFTLSNSDITNKYVTIAGNINNNQSIRLFLDNVGIKAEQGVDYSVSGNQIFWDGYNLQTSLEEGDKLKIFYI